MMAATDDHSFSFTTSADSTFAPLVDASTSDASKRRISGHQLATTTKGRAEVEKAVFAHIRAVRTLGHKTVNTRDVARALSLPTEMVEKVVAGLSKKGVKVAK